MDPPRAARDGKRPWYPRLGSDRGQRRPACGAWSGYASAVSDRAFARPGSEAPWQPSAADLADSRLARFVRDTLARNDARRRPIPPVRGSSAPGPGGRPIRAGSGAPRPTTSASPGSAVRRPRSTWPADRPGRAGGPAARSTTRSRPPNRGRPRRPDDAALAWEGEDGTTRTFTLGASSIARSASPPDGSRPPASAKGPASGSSCRCWPRPRSPSSRSAGFGRSSRPIFSGYAAPAVAARLNAFEATHLITADGFLRRGRDRPAQGGRRRGGRGGARRSGRSSSCAGSVATRSKCRWPRAGTSSGRPGRPTATLAPGGRARMPTVPPTDPEAPYMVIYTSGTTGLPKGTVHVHGGFPIKAAQDLAHTFDLRPGDALCWFTDLGWMMGPWAISGALLLGARLVMYEGAPGLARRRTAVVARRPPPDHPLRDQPDAHPGAPGPRRGARPRPRPVVAPGHRLDRRAVEPRPVAVVLRRRRRRTAADRQLLRRDRDRRRDRRLLAAPADPADELQRPDHRDGRRHRRRIGRSVRGAVGELAIRSPWPGMTRGFWAEPDDDALPRDLLEPASPGCGSTATGRPPTRDGFWYIHGRSDDTLKVAGKRVGPAEVEACAVAHPAVAAAAAIGVPDELKGEAIVVLCVPRPGVAWDATLAARGRRARRPRPRQAGPPEGGGRRPRPAPDPERQGHASGRPGRLARPRPGRHVGPREPGLRRGDRAAGPVKPAGETGPVAVRSAPGRSASSISRSGRGRRPSPRSRR